LSPNGNNPAEKYSGSDRPQSANWVKRLSKADHRLPCRAATIRTTTNADATQRALAGTHTSVINAVRKQART
jgi:hypothetical protein